MNGKIERREKRDAEENMRFWSNIWGSGKSQNKNTEWLKELRSGRSKIKQGIYK